METAEEVLKEERIDPFELFSEDIRLDVHGLTYIGHIEEPIRFVGHTFVLRTLRPNEKAAAAVIVKPWDGTRMQEEMWANAIVGLSLVSVDSRDDFSPAIGPDLNAFATQRLKYVTNAEDGWYQPTLDYLYSAYLSLEARAYQAMIELQNLSLRGRGIS